MTVVGGIAPGPHPRHHMDVSVRTKLGSVLQLHPQQGGRHKPIIEKITSARPSSTLSAAGRKTFKMRLLLRRPNLFRKLRSATSRASARTKHDIQSRFTIA
jgi:hypothetical protein